MRSLSLIRPNYSFCIGRHTCDEDSWRLRWMDALTAFFTLSTVIVTGGKHTRLRVEEKMFHVDISVCMGESGKTKKKN